MHVGTRCLWLSAGLLALSAALAQPGGRLIDAADLTEADTHVDVVIQFSCPVRYLSHLPASQGEAVDVRLALTPECQGVVSFGTGESLPPPAGQRVLRAIELTPLLANEVDLKLSWGVRENFLVAPTADLRGLRVRVVRDGRGEDRSRVLITEPEGTLASGYAINLESSLEPIASSATQSVRQDLGQEAYISTATLDGVQWYRLRIGPFATRAEADRQLLRAQQKYPRAWLAIGDEILHEDDVITATTADDAPSVSGQAPPTGLLATGESQLRKRQYDAAIASFTRYLADATGETRARAREMLGLAQERSGRLALAKAEYEAYLREFRSGRGADRIRRRLAALRTASGTPRTGEGSDIDQELAWRYFGGLSQYYRFDDNVRTIGPLEAQFSSQSALFTDADFVARKRGEAFDSLIRFNGGYVKDMLDKGPGDRVRVSSAYGEIGDAERGWLARFGRQSRSGEGILGTFDGALGSYRWLPHLTTTVAAGFPVESTRAGFNTDRLFQAVSAGFGLFGAWEPSLYVINQTYSGETDRQAVGAEVRYFRPGRTLVGFLDYDVHFAELNNAIVVGTLQLPANWTMTLDLERRKSPLLMTRNALIGQPVRTLDELLGLFTSEEIRQLAIDRTAPSDVASLSFSRPLGQRFQVSLFATSTDIGATVPSGGAEGIPDPGGDLSVSAQILGMSLFQSGDINILAIRYQTNDFAKTSSIGLSTRLPLFGAWRIGPQLRLDRRENVADQSVQTVIAPTLRVGYLWNKVNVELEAGTEWTDRTGLPTNDKTRRTFFSLGYRWNF
jgi:hypothetical protein